ncbi:hypothetical protein, partial [Marichromatium sp. AB32]|uniref:hypothetical protein n=1 Tax=Marichromatium sp. AB32 TaxID=2483363 RepID=UPI001CC1CCA1
ARRIGRLALGSCSVNLNVHNVHKTQINHTHYHIHCHGSLAASAARAAVAAFRALRRYAGL